MICRAVMDMLLVVSDALENVIGELKEELMLLAL
jgi:hypothetical protein